jgi:three-Cys-motif partner protein
MSLPACRPKRSQGNRINEKLLSSDNTTVVGATDVDSADLPVMVPHTAAKHLLLTRYLSAWFPILGKHYSRINYIDGFAGPGEYKRGESGSPILALEAARNHVALGTLTSNVNINFFFIESKPEHAQHLRAKLSDSDWPGQFTISVQQGEFADVFGTVLDELDKEGKQLAPTFAFVDPFGFSGVPFELMARILTFPRCEVYVNIMIEFINRFLDHPNDKVLAHFPSTFGTNEVLDIVKQPRNRINALLALYRRQLKAKAQFVGRFDMHGRKDQKTYSLFFASNAAKGFLKMKEANWSVDKTEGGRFSDFEPGASDQTSLLISAIIWDEIIERFKGMTVPMGALEKFVVEETDYLPKHLRSVLSQREASGEITVVVTQGQKRRKGTFPVGKVSVVLPA